MLDLCSQSVLTKGRTELEAGDVGLCDKAFVVCCKKKINKLWFLWYEN